jgi:hypothetical protein
MNLKELYPYRIKFLRIPISRFIILANGREISIYRSRASSFHPVTARGISQQDEAYTRGNNSSLSILGTISLFENIIQFMCYDPAKKIYL